MTFIKPALIEKLWKNCDILDCTTDTPICHL